jgi:hypothetical protein
MLIGAADFTAFEVDAMHEGTEEVDRCVGTAINATAQSALISANVIAIAIPVAKVLIFDMRQLLFLRKCRKQSLLDC